MSQEEENLGGKGDESNKWGSDTLAGLPGGII